MEAPSRTTTTVAVLEQRPLPAWPAWRALARCAAVTARLLITGRLHLRRDRIGTTIQFADGTRARVYRETVVDRVSAAAPCVLVVTFRLRLVRGWGHAVFRQESVLNTPLFVGFPGFVSKLWLANDERDRYRGLYQWDGADSAQAYARALWRVLALVSTPGSIRYAVLPHSHRDELLAVAAGHTAPDERAEGQWWRPIGLI